MLPLEYKLMLPVTLNGPVMVRDAGALVVDPTVSVPAEVIAVSVNAPGEAVEYRVILPPVVVVMLEPAYMVMEEAVILMFLLTALMLPLYISSNPVIDIAPLVAANAVPERLQLPFTVMVPEPPENVPELKIALSLPTFIVLTP